MPLICLLMMPQRGRNPALVKTLALECGRASDSMFAATYLTHAI
jgi:hypothetical protein